MTDRTLCMMEIHPAVVRWHRERTELFKRWQEIYGGNPFQNVQQSYGQGLAQSFLTHLMGGIGGEAASDFTFPQRKRR